MAKQPSTPVLLIDKVRSTEVVDGHVILTLGSAGAEVRLSLSRNATCMLVQHLTGAVNALFSTQGQANVLAFPAKQARRA